MAASSVVVRVFDDAALFVGAALFGGAVSLHVTVLLNGAMSELPIHVLNGPNLNTLGTRKPEIYGHTTLADVERNVRVRAQSYGLDVVFEPSPYAEARWIAPAPGGGEADLEDFMGKYRPQMARDIDQAPVFLAKSSWETGYVGERFPKVAFTKTKERG